MIKIKKESYLNSVKASIVWKGLDRILAFLKHIIIAGSIGLNNELDVFYVILNLLGVIVFSWANIIDTICVPLMVEYLSADKKSNFKNLAGSLFSFSIFFSFFLAIIFLLFNKQLSLVAIGYNNEKSNLLSSGIRIVIPVVLFYIPLRALGSILRSNRKFTIFYQAEFLNSLIILIIIYFFSDVNNILLHSFNIGILLSFIFIFLFSYSLINFKFYPFQTDFNNVLSIAPGLLILQLAHYVFVLTDQIYISFLNEGDLSAISYAMTIVSLVPGVVSLTGGLITIYSENSNREYRSQITNNLLIYIILIGCFFSYVIFNSSNDIVSILLERGKFSKLDSIRVSGILKYFSILIIPLFLIGPLDQIFQVERKVKIMAMRTIVAICINVILNYLFVFVYHLGVNGVALSTTCSYLAMLIFALINLDKLGYNINWIELFKWIFILIIPISIHFFLEILFFNNLITNFYLHLILSNLIFLVLFIFVIFISNSPQKKLVLNLFARFKLVR